MDQTHFHEFESQFLLLENVKNIYIFDLVLVRFALRPRQIYIRWALLWLPRSSLPRSQPPNSQPSFGPRSPHAPKPSVPQSLGNLDNPDSK